MTADTRREIEFLIRWTLRRDIDRDVVLIVADVAREFGHDDSVLEYAHDYARKLQRDR